MKSFTLILAVLFWAWAQPASDWIPSADRLEGEVSDVETESFFSGSQPFAPAPYVYSQRDSFLFLEKQKLGETGSTLAERTLGVAQSFLGTPYVLGCLDRSAEEQLTVNLRQLDCWTFVENSLAIALAGEEGFSSYAAHLQRLRYWNGRVDGYGSRIHYFSAWMMEAEKNGVLHDLSREMGGIPYRKTIGYISARPAKYPRMKDAGNLRALRTAEKYINAHSWFFIPKNKVAQTEHLIREGDIILLTTVKRDLDIAHQGFAVKIKGRIYLMHASSLARRVVIAKQPLPEYMATQRGQSGIMVARLSQ